MVFRLNMSNICSTPSLTKYNRFLLCDFNQQAGLSASLPVRRVMDTWSTMLPGNPNWCLTATINCLNFLQEPSEDECVTLLQPKHLLCQYVNNAVCPLNRALYLRLEGLGLWENMFYCCTILCNLMLNILLT